MTGRVDLIVVGCSWGGLKALGVVLGGLPASLPAAVVLAQHRAATSTEALAAALRRHARAPVHEVEDKDPVEPGAIYLAPPDYHLLIEPGGVFGLSVDRPVQFSRPSVDVLFESAAQAYGPRVAAVVLTGANADGANGLRAVKRAGGITVVQDPDTAEQPAMPEAALATGAADKVLPLPEIAPFLVELCVGSGHSTT
jgi:two-component system chemotaxis response regulator CheB